MCWQKVLLSKSFSVPETSARETETTSEKQKDRDLESDGDGLI